MNLLRHNDKHLKLGLFCLHHLHQKVFCSAKILKPVDSSSHDVLCAEAEWSYLAADCECSSTQFWLSEAPHSAGDNRDMERVGAICSVAYLLRVYETKIHRGERKVSEVGKNSVQSRWVEKLRFQCLLWYLSGWEAPLHQALWTHNNSAAAT